MEYSLENRPNIVLFKDILDEWSEKTGKDKKLLEDIYKHHCKYLLHVMETNEDAYTINIPNLGKLYMNHYLSLTLSKKSNPSYIKRVKKLSELARGFKDRKEATLHYNVPIFIRFSNFFQKIERPFTNFYNYVNFIEDINKDILDGQDVTVRYRPKDKKRRGRKFSFKYSVEKARSL